MEKNEKIEELKGLETQFDFDELFSGKSKYGAALRVITPSQEITVPTLSHAEAAQKIMEVIYGNYQKENFEESFPDELNKKNAIAILMMNGSFEIIYIPNVINSFQFERIIDFKNQTEDLCRNTGRSIALHTNVFNNGQRELNKVIDVVKTRVDDNYEYPKEYNLHQNVKVI